MFNPQRYDELIGKYWRHKGYEYQLVGIMYDAEDNWFMMARGGKLNKHTQMLSCVLDIETYGFELIK